MNYLFVYKFLEVFRKTFLVAFKGVREGDLHFFKALIASDAFENGPMVSPFAIASSASFSISCHSFVQNHSWSLGINFLGTSISALSLTCVSRKSPTSRRSESKTSFGMVIWCFGPILTAGICLPPYFLTLSIFEGERGSQYIAISQPSLISNRLQVNLNDKTIY